MDYRNIVCTYQFEEFASKLYRKLKDIRNVLEENYVENIEDLNKTNIFNFFDLIKKYNLIDDCNDINDCVDKVVDNIYFVDELNSNIDKLFTKYISKYGYEETIRKILSCCDIFRILSVLNNIDSILLNQLSEYI